MRQNMNLTLWRGDDHVAWGREVSEVCPQHLGATQAFHYIFLAAVTFCCLYEWNFQIPSADLLSHPLEGISALNLIVLTVAVGWDSALQSRVCQRYLLVL